MYCLRVINLSVVQNSGF